MEKKKKILLYGPSAGQAIKSYGGGTGGYVRNMTVYKNHFQSDFFLQIPCYHSVRGEFRFKNFALRLIYDVFIFVKALLQNNPKGVHILGRYRPAIVREFMVVLVARFFRVTVLYDLKAGHFIKWYKSTHFLFRWMAKFCLTKSKIVLSEGIPNIDFLKKELGINVFYFPNFVPDAEVSATPRNLFSNPKLSVLFVGYCIKEKGIFELVEACNLAAKEIPISLTIVGQEHPDFTEWMEKMNFEKEFTIKRLGKQPHSKVIEQFTKNDIYCYPTSYQGEGHNNTINEAMMMEMIIVTTRHGFLDSILSEDRAYFMNQIQASEIAQIFQKINENRPLAKQKARKAKQHLMENFLSSIAFEKLEKYYQKL
ncbi:MAG: glycosyltransferase family 4 protein [Saprospiraceae bacterium]